MFARISSFVAAAALAVSLVPAAAGAQFLAPIGHFPGGLTSSQGTQGTQGNGHVVKSGGPKWCQTCLQTQNHSTNHTTTTNYNSGRNTGYASGRSYNSGRSYSAGYNYGAGHTSNGAGRFTYGTGRNSYNVGHTNYGSSNSLVHGINHPLVDSSRALWKAPAGNSSALIR